MDWGDLQNALHKSQDQALLNNSRTAPSEVRKSRINDQSLDCTQRRLRKCACPPELDPEKGENGVSLIESHADLD